MAKHSIVTIIADGSTNQFAISFTGGFMSRDHVTARVNDEVDGLGDPAYRTITWIDDGIVQIDGDLPASGDEVVFRRTTPIDLPVNDFQNDTVLLDAALDSGFEQCIKRLQEIDDIADELAIAEGIVDEAQSFSNAAEVSRLAAETAQASAEDAVTEVEDLLSGAGLQGAYVASANGISPLNTGAVNSTALDTLMTTASLTGRPIVFDETGTFEFESTIFLKNNVTMVDPSYGKVIIKLSDTAHDDASGFSGAVVTDENPVSAIENVTIVGFTLDGNEERSSTIGTSRPGGSAFGAGYCKNWRGYHITAHSWKLHGFDLANGGEWNGTYRQYSTGDMNHPTSNRSENMKLMFCRAYNCGDDAFTTHFVDDYSILFCTAENASGRHPSLNGGNLFEVDDGSGRGVIMFCLAIGPANTAYAVKCHDGYPAPNNVVVAHNTARNVARGYYLNDPNSPTISPTAYNVSFLDNELSDPMFYDKPSNGDKSDTDIAGIAIGEYTSFTVSGNVIRGDGTYLEETTDVLDSGSRVTSSAIEVESSGKLGVITNNRVSDWASDNVTESGVAGIKITSSIDALTVMGNVLHNTGYRGIVNSGDATATAFVGNIIVNDTVLTDSIGLRVSTVPAEGLDGYATNRVTGFTYAASAGSNEYTTMKRFAGRPISYATRGTNIEMDTATEHDITNFSNPIDTHGIFNGNTGVFTAPWDGIFEFEFIVQFEGGDGTDDSGEMGFLLDGSTEVGMIAINPRALTEDGVESPIRVTHYEDMTQGQTIQARIAGMSATTTVTAEYFKMICKEI